MFKKLRWRFIFISMLSVFSVLIIIIGGLNVINYFEMRDTADAIIELLLENGGRFPDLPPIGEDKPQGGRPQGDGDGLPPGGKPEKGDQDTKPKDNAPPPFDGPVGDFNERPLYKDNMPSEIPYSSRFFVATIVNDEVTNVDSDKIASISEEDAKNYALSRHVKGDKKGYCYGFRYGCKTEGDTTLYIFLDETKELYAYNKSFFVSIVSSISGLLIVFFLVLILSKRIVKPMSESYEKQKQFITDAGHELKTPLAIINAEVDVIEMDYGESEWTSGIKGQVERLSTLTSNLITLSKMEEAARADFKEFSISETASRVICNFTSLATSKSKVLTSHIQEGIKLYGSEGAIRQLITILLDNAFKYSDERGSISLTLKSINKKAEITVFNTVNEIEIGQHKEYFERFYRRDKSRSSEISGSGIGLSVAKAITQNHLGKISAESKDGKSFIVKAILPLK